MNASLFTNIFHNATTGLMCCDPEGQLVAVNPRAAELLQQTGAQDDRARLFGPACHQRLKTVLDTDQVQTFTDEAAGEDGQTSWIRNTWRRFQDPDTQGCCVLVTLDDITDQINAEKKCADRTRMLQFSEQAATIGSWHTDLRTNQTIWSENLYKILGWPVQDTPPANNFWLPTIDPSPDSTAAHAERDREERILQCLRGEAPFIDEFTIVHQETGEQRIVRSISQIRLDDQGQPEYAIGTLQDITEQKKREEEVTRLSYYDDLTGLYNRRFFEAGLSRFDTSRQNPLSIILCDIKGLKLINRLHGNAAGDQLLQAVADLLRKNCRTEDLIARWGGDEFIIALPRTSAADAARVHQRIRESGSALSATILIGQATREDETTTIAQLLEQAEAALQGNSNETPTNAD